MAAAPALAALGRGVRWRHGVIAAPIRLHTWIKAGGRPVAEPDSTLMASSPGSTPRGGGTTEAEEHTRSDQTAPDTRKPQGEDLENASELGFCG